MYQIGGEGVITFSATKAWGVGPASASGTLSGDPGLSVGDYVAVSFGGVQFAGICTTITEVVSKGQGRVFSFDLLDNRIRLQWQVAFGAWNMPVPLHGEANRIAPASDSSQYSSNSDTAADSDDLSLSGSGGLDAGDEHGEDLSSQSSDPEQRRRFWHILPTNYAKNIKTFTDDPLTAKEVINSLMSGAWGDYGFIRQFHSDQASDAVHAIDALQGKIVGNLISEINGRMGLSMYLSNTRTLVWDRKGTGNFSAPALPVNGSPGGCMEALGESLASWPTRIRVVGEKALVQVIDIELESDWAAGWEDFIDELKWVREVGSVYQVPGSSIEEIAERNALAREITVGDYIREKGASLEDFADRGSWGKLSRMDIPAWVYINEIVFRSYRIPRDYEFRGIPLSSLTIHEGLLCGVEVSEEGEMKYRLEPLEFYPSSQAFVMAQGQPLDLVDLRAVEGFVQDRSEDLREKWRPVNDFRINPWEASILFDSPVFVDGLVEEEESLFIQPNKGQGGYADHASFSSGKDYEKIRIRNPGFVPGTPGVKASFVFEVGPWGKTYGSGPRRSPHFVRNLQQHLLDEADTVSTGVSVPDVGPFGSDVSDLKEILYQGGKSCEDISDLLAASVVQRDASIDTGRYKMIGVAGTQLNGAVDRITSSISKSGGIVEVVELVKEASSESFVAEHELEQRRRVHELFGGQSQLQAEVREIRELGKLQSRERDASKVKSASQRFSDPGNLVIGDQHSSPLLVEDIDGAGPDDDNGNWKTGHVVWLDQVGKPSAKELRFGGVVTSSINGTSGGQILHTSTRGIVPTMVKGPFSAGEMVGCDPGDSVAKRGGKRPVGRINHAKGFDKDEVIVASVRLTSVGEYCAPFTPILLEKEEGACVGIKPGWILFHEPMLGESHDGLSLSREEMPTLNDERIDDEDDPPCEELGEGEHTLWLFVGRYRGKFEFEDKGAEARDPEPGERQIKVADFEVFVNDDDEITSVDLIDQFVIGPYIYWSQGAACFETIAWGEENGWKALVRGGDYHDSGSGTEGKVDMGAGGDTYASGPVDVDDGDFAWIEWDTDEYGVLTSTPVLKFGETVRPMTPHSPPCNEFVGEAGEYSKTVAEFVASDDLMSLFQRHTGTIWITPDRTCEDDPEEPPESDDSTPPGSDPVTPTEDPTYEVVVNCIPPSPAPDESGETPDPPDPVPIPVPIPTDDVPEDGYAYFTLCVHDGGDDGYMFALYPERTEEPFDPVYGLPDTLIVDGEVYTINEDGVYENDPYEGLPSYIRWDEYLERWVWTKDWDWTGGSDRTDPTGPYVPNDGGQSGDPDWVIIYDPNEEGNESGGPGKCDHLPSKIILNDIEFILDPEDCVYRSEENSEVLSSEIYYEDGEWHWSSDDGWVGGSDPNDPTGIFIYPGDGDSVIIKLPDPVPVPDPQPPVDDPFVDNLPDGERRLVSPTGIEVILSNLNRFGDPSETWSGEGPNGENIVLFQNEDGDWELMVDGAVVATREDSIVSEEPAGDFTDGWVIENE